jgi:hypothetical protein
MTSSIKKAYDIMFCNSDVYVHLYNTLLNEKLKLNTVTGGAGKGATNVKIAIPGLASKKGKAVKAKRKK